MKKYILCVVATFLFSSLLTLFGLQQYIVNANKYSAGYVDAPIIVVIAISWIVFICVFSHYYNSYFKVLIRARIKGKDAYKIAIENIKLQELLIKEKQRLRELEEDKKRLSEKELECIKKAIDDEKARENRESENYGESIYKYESKDKILKIEDGIMFIGIKEGNRIIKVPLSSANYSPQVGDAVHIYNSDEDVIVAKSDVESVIKKKNTTTHNNTTIHKGAKVHKGLYLLLCLFGIVGFHKFYEGKAGMGLLYIMFCWTFIPLIATIFEFIDACGKKADKDGCIYV